MQKPIEHFTDKELADMVRNGAYLRRTIFNETGSRFLLVLAVPYGNEDGVDDLQEALTAFFELVQSDDYKERNIQVYDNATGEYFETSLETVECNGDGGGDA